jgi:bifunctional DNA-binding transcriptional regulator/antitoxin component of YhaV-PrlF toxin-antitoxin module
MKTYTSIIRTDGSVTIPRMLRIQMGIASNDLVTIEPDKASGILTLKIHHVKGEPKS